MINTCEIQGKTQRVRQQTESKGQEKSKERRGEEGEKRVEEDQVREDGELEKCKTRSGKVLPRRAEAVWVL